MNNERLNNERLYVQGLERLGSAGLLSHVHWRDKQISDPSVLDEQISEGLDANEIVVVNSQTVITSVQPSELRSAVSQLFRSSCDTTQYDFDQMILNAGNQFSICLIRPMSNGTMIVFL